MLALNTATFCELISLFKPLQSGYGFDELIDEHAEQTYGKGDSHETISQ